MLPETQDVKAIYDAIVSAEESHDRLGRLRSYAPADITLEEGNPPSFCAREYAQELTTAGCFNLPALGPGFKHRVHFGQHGRNY